MDLELLISDTSLRSSAERGYAMGIKRRYASTGNMTSLANAMSILPKDKFMICIEGSCQTGAMSIPRWIESIKDYPKEKRDYARSLVIQETARMNQKKAIQWLESSGWNKDDMANVVRGSVQASPSSGYEWARTLDDDKKNHALTVATATWLSLDPYNARNWVKKMAPGNDRDISILAILTSTGERSSKKYGNWLGLIHAEKNKEAAVNIMNKQ